MCMRRSVCVRVKLSVCVCVCVCVFVHIFIHLLMHTHPHAHTPMHNVMTHVTWTDVSSSGSSNDLITTCVQLFLVIEWTVINNMDWQ